LRGRAGAGEQVDLDGDVVGDEETGAGAGGGRGAGGTAGLQDFFGMKETPRAGQTPVVVQLLAPNQRPVQVTQDLADCWERHYPALRRELGR
jgi:hypothetical protein